LKSRQATRDVNIPPCARGLSFKFGSFARFLSPALTPPERTVAEV
jgi:hypothetical protein